ncbi:MAG: alpha/beta fold hydrolase [Hyphomicrobiales bacterium]|nr:alpha/beta fold hydrolase [Hyphomicrobiales bacterium]MBV8442264.1 alpha/beta fold hydrolase [Hyphomicrobiales bacterium]
MENLEGDIAPPSTFLLAIEPRGLFSVAPLIAAAPFLATAPRGTPHAVIVLPGLGATDRSTIVIRRYLNYLGHHATGWHRGRNVRPAGADLPAIAAQIGSLREMTGKPVSLVGWSRGGIIAREAARLAPDAVRMVVTLGSPFAAPGASNVGVLWRRLTGEAFPAHTRERMRALGAPLPVPSTSIYSRSDGVVAWQACRQTEGAQSENVEVRGSHTGLGFNPTALWVIADRLAQPPGAWAPFRPSPVVARLLPWREGGSWRRSAPNA